MGAREASRVDRVGRLVPERRSVEATYVDGDTLESSYRTEASRLRLQTLLERQGVPFESRGAGGSRLQSILGYLSFVPFVGFAIVWLFLAIQGQRAGERRPRIPEDESGS